LQVIKRSVHVVEIPARQLRPACGKRPGWDAAEGRGRSEAEELASLHRILQVVTVTGRENPSAIQEYPVTASNARW
jgi:hypothetical protein